MAEKQDCVPLAVVTKFIDDSLQRARVSKQVRAQVAADMAGLQSIDGQVIGVETEAGKRTVVVAQGSRPVSFHFPPNQPAFETELLRAQDAGRVVSVTFSTDGAGENIVVAVWVWAGVGSGAERY